MSLNAKLVVVGGDVKTAEIRLRLPSTIGRGRGTTIMLPHPLVSRQHCELFESNGQLMVRDLGSLNGTFVNNRRISESPLPHGELLTIGTVTFRAVYEPELAAVAAPAQAAHEAASGTNGKSHTSGPASGRSDAGRGEGSETEENYASTEQESSPREERSTQTTQAASVQPAHDDETVDISSFNQPPEEELDTTSENDDDLGDFLKSLQK